MDKDELKEQVYTSVLQFFGDECRAPLTKSGRVMLRQLLQKTLWGAIDDDDLKHWDVHTQKYIYKIVKKIADKICDDIDEDDGDQIDQHTLFHFANPIIRDAKDKGTRKLARLREIAAAGDNPNPERIAFYEMVTKYCDNYE